MRYLYDLIDFYNKISQFGHSWDTGQIDRSFTNLQNLQEISIPYFDAKVNLYHAFKLLGKLFTFNNEKENYALIVYDFEKRIILESVLINLSDTQALIQEVITDPLPENLNLEGNISLVFQSVRKFIQNKYAVQVNRIKIIHPQIFDKITNKEYLGENAQKLTGFQRMVFILLEACENNQLITFPELPFISAISRLVKILRDYHHIAVLGDLMKSLFTPITLFDEDWYITINREGKHPSSTAYIQKPFEFGRITIKDHYQWIHFVKEFNTQYSKKYHQNASYFLDINWCIDFLSDVCESEFPLTKSRFEFLLQRLLYFVKQNEDLWDVVPRPIIYNGYVRLIIRLCGFHINPRKLSYWSISSNFMHFLRSNFSPSSRNVILLTKKGHPLTGFVCKLEGYSISEINQLPIDLLKFPFNNRKELFNYLISRFGFINSIIQLDKDILYRIFKFIIIDRNTKNPLKLLSALFLIKKLNNMECFDWYPPPPGYIIFKKMGAVRYFRLLNKLLYDFLEF